MTARADSVRMPHPVNISDDIRRPATCAAFVLSTTLIHRACPGLDVTACTCRLCPSSAWAKNFAFGIQKSRLNCLFRAAARSFSSGLRRAMPARP